MKRILLAFDGEHFSQAVFDFAKQLNDVEPVNVVGFFLPALDYAELLYSFGGVPAGPLYVVEAVAGDETIVKNNIQRLKTLCEEHNVPYTIEVDKSRHIVDAVKDESKFADLLVMDGQSIYNNMDESVRQEYVSSIVHKATCPAVILPGNYTRPASNLIAYDGSEAAVFAVKQFRYLLPHLSGLPTLLVYFGGKDKAIPARKEAEDFFHGYFPRLTITKLDISDKNAIGQWIESNRNSMVITGAKGRSTLSEMFKTSFADKLLAKHAMPVFIAHS